MTTLLIIVVALFLLHKNVVAYIITENRLLNAHAWADNRYIDALDSMNTHQCVGSNCQLVGH